MLLTIRIDPKEIAHSVRIEDIISKIKTQFKEELVDPYYFRKLISGPFKLDPYEIILNDKCLIKYEVDGFKGLYINRDFICLIEEITISD